MFGMKPYSGDLHTRIVAAVEGGMPKTEAKDLKEVAHVARNHRIAKGQGGRGCQGESTLGPTIRPVTTPMGAHQPARTFEERR